MTRAYARWSMRPVEVFGLDPDFRESFDEYVRARGPRLVRTAYLLTGDLHIAEDVVQNALASMIVSWRRLREVANLDAYAYRSVVNAGRRWRRRRWNGEIPFAELPEEEPEDRRDQFDGHMDMIAALRRLPARQRAVLVLRYYADLTEAETATILGCSVGTVKSQCSRGLAVLRARLQQGDHGGRGAGTVASRSQPGRSQHRRTTR